MSSSSSLFKLYGVPLSQPFRAVAWTLLQLKVPFKVQLTVPGSTGTIGSRHESFLNKTAGRTGRVPILEITEHANDEDESTWFISESPAIMMYLCERCSTDSATTTILPKLYAPPASRQKTLMDSYLHWHHEGTRGLISVTKPFLRPDLETTRSDDGASVHGILTALDQAWLNNGMKYLASNDEPSIADILAYEEVAQFCYLTGGGPLLNGSLWLNDNGTSASIDNYPRLNEWMARMQELPFHRQAHVALTTLGSIVGDTSNDVPLAKRLGAATKAGLQALEQAQAMY